MKKINLLLFGLSVFSMLAGAQGFDPYNNYIWNRANYQMDGGRSFDRGDWFEWWYYKVVEPQTGQAYFFTYGVINPWDTAGRSPGNSAVMQVGDFSNRFLISQRFPLSDFNASYETTDVQIASNHATDKRIQGHLTDEKGNDVQWDLQIEKQWGFNAMGWTMGIPDITGIYWYPVQAAATMTGWLRSNGRTVTFDHAPAYQDRNWGRSFPRWWTWLTANGFKGHPDSVLAAGGGEPKIFNAVYFKGGLCIGFKHEGQEYAFRAVDLDKFDFNIHWGVWQVAAENHHGQRIEITATAPAEKFFDIVFFSPQGDQFHDYEALTGHMTVKLFRWDNWSWGWKLVTELETDQAGVEWGSPEAVDFVGLKNFTRLYNTATPLLR